MVNTSVTSSVLKVYQERMKFLLSDKDKRVDVNYQSENGSNFLMIAASNGHDDIVELLLERGGTDLSYRPTYRPIGGKFPNQTVLTVARDALNRYENSSPSETNRDPEHIRVKRIESYNRIVRLLEEAGAVHEEEVDAVHEETDANTVFDYFRRLFRL